MISIDVFEFVFYHCDLSPTNLLFNTSTGCLGIVSSIGHRGGLRVTFLSNGFERSFDFRLKLYILLTSMGMKILKINVGTELVSSFSLTGKYGTS